MENKYYTPTIEEFCVGFEYEYKEKKVWKKDELDISGMTSGDCGADHYVENDIDFILDKLKSNDIRVKYLDREDIESFGFKFNEEKTKQESGYITYTKTVKKWNFTRVTHLHHRQGDSVYKSMVAIHEDGDNSFGIIYKFIDVYYPKIEIKNKTELKKYLNQTNLLEERYS